MTNNLETMNSDNIDHIMSYLIGPEYTLWNHDRHAPHLSQCFDLGRHLTRTRQDFYSRDGRHVVNWIPRRVQRIVNAVHGYLMSCTTARAHPIIEFCSLLHTRWHNLHMNTPTNIPIPEQRRFTMYFATLGESDRAIQRYGINVTAVMRNLPIKITPNDEYGHEWSEHYDDYGRPCPHDWPHGRHWQWAPRNMATTYSIPLSKRQTYRIRQLIAHNEWVDESENRMIVELIDHRTDITYVLLAGDAVFAPSHPDMRDLQHNNHLFADRSPVIHTTLARSGYSWPPWPHVRNDRYFAELFISFPTYIRDPLDILLTPPQTLFQTLQSFTTRPYVDADDAADDTDLHTDILDDPTRITPWPANRTDRTIELLIQIRLLNPPRTHREHIHNL